MNFRSHIFYLPVLLCGSLLSQDIHFSQFSASLLNLSPAYTGMFNGDYRVGANYRSQWNTVPVAYSTFSMYGEKRWKPLWLEKDAIGVGLLFNNDRAGDARYGTTQLYFSGSYLHNLKTEEPQNISVGISTGYCLVGFDYQKMTFDRQYDGINFNSSAGSGENFSRTSRQFFDMGLGVGWNWVHNKKHRISYGLGVHHLTSPVITYQGNDLSRLDYKFSNCISYSTPTGDQTDIIAEALIGLQGKNYEIVPHFSLKYFFDRLDNKAILGGLLFRTRDAVILRLGYDHKMLQSGISYDINISRFTPATNRRGGFELFVNYIIKSPPTFIARKRYCPQSI